jgi:hypothetical protein
VLACVAASTFFTLRYQLIPYFVTHPVDQGNAWLLFDKWQLGALRLLNFAAFGALFTAVRPYISRRIAWSPLVLLGKSSLEIFCVHVLFCFAALSLVGDGATAPLSYQIAIVARSLLGLYTVAYLRSRPQSQYAVARSIVTASPSTQFDELSGMMRGRRDLS